MGYRGNIQKLTKFSFFLAIAVIISVVEFFLPRPLPYVKPGFANLIVILVLCEYGFREAAILTILKSLLSAAVLGYFFSPTFYLSIGGAVVSVLAMGMVKNFFADSSLYFISIIGALAHSFTQLMLVFTFFLKNSIIFVNIVPLSILAILTGYVNGLLAKLVIKRVGFSKI